MGADIDRHSVRPRPRARARPRCFWTAFDFEDEHDLNTLLSGATVALPNLFLL
jgi:hypothetical protein